MRVKQVFGGASLAIVLAGLGYGAWMFVGSVWRVFSALNSSVAVSIVSASAAVIVSTTTVVLGKARDARLAVEKDVREKKIPVYEELIQFMLRVVLGSKTGQTPSGDEILSFFSDFTQRFMVWGADDVVKAWVEFRRATINADGEAKDSFGAMLLYEGVVRAIRKDLGHRNAGLKKGDILGLFVNDAHTAIAKRETEAHDK